MASAPMNKQTVTPGKPPATGAPAGGAEKNRKNALITAGSAVLALGLLIGYFVWRSKANTPPPLNESTTALVKFASSGNFEKLPFEDQKRYMITLDGRDDIEDAYKKGQLSEAQLRLAKELAWFGKQLDRMDRYYSEGPAGRTAYIAKLAEKKVKKEAKPGSNKTKQDDEDDDVDRDEASETLRPQTWPKDVQAKWNEFRGAYKAAKKAREDALNPATKPTA